ncbi:MAG: serine/threonine-protein kinase [Planctomycetota bacterium]
MSAELPERIACYRVERELGRGGMGVVLAALGPSGERVAIKLLLDPDRKRRQRFLREARIQAKLDHPHVARVREVGEDAGREFIVFDWFPGGSLADRIHARGPLPPDEAAAFGAALADALAAAHARGVLHRDVKPDNVLLDAEGRPALTDFGLAKDLERTDHTQRLTRSGALLGTPSYWAPEQSRGDHARIGPAADVYALGATLYTALSGEPVFAARSLLELLNAVQESPPPPLRGHRADVPAELEALVLACLAKDPDERPAASALATALRALAPAAAGRRAAWPWLLGALSLSLALGALAWARTRPAPAPPAPLPSLATSAAPTSAAPASATQTLPAEEDSTAQAFYELARQAALAGRDAEAARLARQAAEGGHAAAMFELAAMLEEGRGLAKDAQEARRWLEAAAERGSTGAMIDLALLYRDGRGVPRDPVRCVTLLRRAAEAGDTQGMFDLGVCLSEGAGVQRSDAAAVRLYRQGAELGHAGCMNNLGLMLSAGRGVAKDLAESASWYRRAADAGDELGMLNLGLVLMRGEGVARDLDQAEGWLKRAAAGRDAQAKDTAAQALEQVKLLRALGLR